MLFQQTLDKLRRMRMHFMAKGADEQRTNPTFQNLGFEERLGYIVDLEYQERENRGLQRRRKNAKLKVAASLEDIDTKTERGLVPKVVAELTDCRWILQFQNLLITGLAGVGKTWISCAFGEQACRKGMTVMYRRVARLLDEIAIARGDGSLPKLRTQLAKTQLLILDDFGLSPFRGQGRDDLLELIDDRCGSGSVIVASQMPRDNWHDYLGNDAAADAILDRLINDSWKMDLHGESQRKLRAKR